MNDEFFFSETGFTRQASKARNFSHYFRIWRTSAAKNMGIIQEIPGAACLTADVSFHCLLEASHYLNEKCDASVCLLNLWLDHQ